MAQRLATAVRHPLASAASTPPQLPLGDETPRNDEELPLGDETPGTKRRPSPAGERGNIDAAPASLGGTKPRGTIRWRARKNRRPSFPWGKKPQGKIRWRARQHRPPQLPLGDETPRHNLLASAATSAAPASLGGQNPEDQRRASPGGQKPGNRRRASLGGRNPRDNNNRQRPTFKGAVKKKTTTTKMTPNHQG